MTPDDVADVLEAAGWDTESLTVVLVGGANLDQVAAALGPDLGIAVDDVEPSPDHDVYVLSNAAGGVVAVESSGYADPSTDVLAALSRLGGTAAVARSNIQGHERFGCAEDGVLVFDAHEYVFIEEDEKDAVPDSLRDLFDSAWIDLDAEDAEPAEGPAGVLVAVAMAARFTGVTFAAEDLGGRAGSLTKVVRTLTYDG